MVMTSPSDVEDEPGERADEAGGGDGQDPGDEDAAGDAPADAADALARADAHDRARDDVGRRDRHRRSGPSPRRIGRRGRLGREAVDRLQLGDALAHRLHDPPAADRRAQRDRRRRDDDDPGRHVDVGMTPAENRASVMMPIVFWASFEPWAKAM